MGRVRTNWFGGFTTNPSPRNSGVKGVSVVPLHLMDDYQSGLKVHCVSVSAPNTHPIDLRTQLGQLFHHPVLNVVIVCGAFLPGILQLPSESIQ